MTDHDPADCLQCMAGTPHDGLVPISPGTGSVSTTDRTADNNQRAATGASADLSAGPVELLKHLESGLAGVLASMQLAEQEILLAQRRHGERPPDRDDSGKVISEKGPLWRSFRLLQPTGLMDQRAEFVYRGHCQEILDRVASGQDTRPATDAELIVELGQVSLAAPLHGEVVGLYLRLIARRFPDVATHIVGVIPQTVEDYEKMFGRVMDEHEEWARTKMRQEWRRLPAELQATPRSVKAARAVRSPASAEPFPVG